MNRVYPVVAAAVLLATLAPAATTASGISSVESDEIEMSYSLLTQEFYKKVDQQTILDGARSDIVAYLQKAGIKNPKVAELHAGDDPSANARALEHAVNAAVASYGAKTGGSRPLTYQAIAGLLASVKDKYTTFLTPKQYADLNESLDGGNFSGVGISIQVDEKTKLLDVNEVIPDGPAEKAGLQDGDVVLEIDGKTTKGLTTEQDAKLLRGEKGSTV
ncbi:MAG: PDZ domain-containing protein, partial [Candidatus Eremiobacteraeota bacterium]|nr:PDZ domain-containing protein [Candidatus Eremiobacteraeota bacterium]